MATKILFLTPSGATLPSVRFRVLPFVKLGLEKGLDISWKRIPKSIFQRFSFFRRLPKADIYIVQAKLFSAREVNSLKHRCGMLVYDFDDAVWTMPPFDLAFLRKRRKAERAARLFANQCAKADLCIAGNRFLADKAAQYQNNISIIPTGLDTEGYRPDANRMKNEAVIVGWMGTSGYLDYVEKPISLLKDQVGAIQFSVISNAQYTGDGKRNVIWTAWSSDNEISQLQAMDIGLMPLENSEYSRGKCGFKILQYMACGAVPVASDIGFNAEIIEHGIDGFLVREPEDWKHYVMKLVNDPELRNKMRDAARSKVTSEFDIKMVAASLWKSLGV